jgi:flagellar hook-associated protein 3 FlgL
MRITPLTIIEQALANLDAQTNSLGQLQQEAATGNRLLQPSDDPVATVAVLAANAQSQSLDSYQANIQTAQTTLNASVTALQSASDIFTQAKQIASEGANSVNDPSSFEALAQQVDALIKRLVGVANSQNNGTYLFGGTASGKTPFSVATADSQGRPLSVIYQGSTQRASAPISQQQTVDTLYSGGEIFQQQTRGTTAFAGSTGAAAGTGTDSAAGEGTLLVTHTTTVYGPGSGIQAGTGSASGDTIIGPTGTHSLTVIDTSGTGASGTVSLDGGPPVAFTNTDTNLKVTGADGNVVYVNTTAITAGFNGPVSITANGALSVDGGATSVPINFSSNQVVTNSTTGAVTNVDSTKIRNTGTDDLSYTGTFDAFQSLIALRDDLRNTRGLSSADQAQVLSQSLSELQRVQEGILKVVGQQSADLQNLQSLGNQLSQVKLNTQQRITDLQGADVAQVVVGLQAQQNLLQLTLASTARQFQQSLLDFLH